MQLDLPAGIDVEVNTLSFNIDACYTNIHAIFPTKDIQNSKPHHILTPSDTDPHGEKQPKEKTIFHPIPHPTLLTLLISPLIPSHPIRGTSGPKSDFIFTLGFFSPALATVSDTAAP